LFVKRGVKKTRPVENRNTKSTITFDIQANINLFPLLFHDWLQTVVKIDFKNRRFPLTLIASI